MLDLPSQSSNTLDLDIDIDIDIEINTRISTDVVRQHSVHQAVFIP